MPPTNTNEMFTFEDCDFCGLLMEPANFELRNVLEDNGIIRFDFCPCCGSNMIDLKNDPDWQAQVMRWVIKRRLEKSRLANGRLKE